MQAIIARLANALKVPEIEQYRLTICYTKLEGWYFVDTDGTPSYAYPNLRLKYEKGALSLTELIEMIEKL